MTFSIVAAVDQENGLGRNGDLAWRLKEDMAFFKALTVAKDPRSATEKFGLDLKGIDFHTSSLNTPVKEATQNAVLMGRKTWDSIPSAYAPLVERHNIVLTRDVDTMTNSKKTEDISYCSSLNEALEQSQGSLYTYLIGGGNLYKQGITHPQCDALFLTQLKGTFGCDTFFPKIPDSFQLLRESDFRIEGDIEFKYTLWRRTS
jgi:dihydrofolate reductase